VSGIGPKVARAILSGIEPGDLVRAVRQSDLARLTSIPGVGRKTAERVVVDLRDRLGKLGDAGPADQVSGDGSGDNVRDDVLSALANLGYQRAAAEKAVDKVLRNITSRALEPVLRDALKELAR
jgi:Holliday junction DNA helicase RuvA